MSDITIPDVDDDLKQRLKQRAAQHGQSMQAEARDILKNALSTEPTPAADENIADAVRAIIEPLGGFDLEPFPRQPVREPPSFK